MSPRRQRLADADPWGRRGATREPLDPVTCRGHYQLPPVSSGPYDPRDPATDETEQRLPAGRPGAVPHWAERMDRHGERFDIPPRSRDATLENIPGDIADGVMATSGPSSARSRTA